MIGRRSKSRQNQNGEILHFATAASDLGAILVASSAKGVVAVLIGADRAEVTHELEHRFPNSNPILDQHGQQESVNEVVRYIQNPVKDVDLTIDLRGTDFQKKVWQAVRKIPPGATMTYAQVAAHIGHAKAIRAVGNACTINPLAFAIPCHRVLHRDPKLSFDHDRGNDRMRPMVAREQKALAGSKQQKPR